MKNILLTVFMLTTINLFSQNKEIYTKKDTVSCDSISVVQAYKIAAALKSGDFQNAKQLHTTWKNTCFYAEIIEREDIIFKINEGINADNLIQDYFNNDLHFVYKYRLQFAENVDYQYYYEDYRTYLNYIPLRHPLDSALEKMSQELLLRKNITSDERIALNLFTGKIRNFNRESKKSTHKTSFLHQFNNADKRYLSRESIGISLYAGMYAPFSEQPIGNNPYVGFTLGTPLKYLLQGEFYMKFRIHNNDRNFDYQAFGTGNSVNSSYGFNMGINAGYTLYENNDLLIIPKLGVGFDAINTGLSSFDDETQETTYYNVTTLHTSVAVSILKPIFRRNYIGMEVTYHYCPYGWDEDLISKLENNAYSVELIFRF